MTYNLSFRYHADMTTKGLRIGIGLGLGLRLGVGLESAKVEVLQIY